MAVDDSGRHEWAILARQADEAMEARHHGSDGGAHHDDLLAPRSAHLALLALQAIEFDHHYEDGEP